MEIFWVLPEIYLVIALLGIVLAEISFVGERWRWTTGIALFALALAFYDLFFPFREGFERIFYSSLSIDGISRFFRFLFVVIGAGVLTLMQFSREIDLRRRAEYSIYVLAGVVALNIVSAAVNLLVIFIGVQLVGFVAVLLAGHSTNENRSIEAAFKFYLFGVLGWAFFLIATAIVFTYTQSFNLYDIRQFLNESTIPPLMGSITFGLFFLSLAFMLGIFPMYFWVPDVVEGAPTPSSLFVSLAMPLAGFAVAIRLFTTVFGTQAAQGVAWEALVAAAAGASMLAGGLLALRQTSAKRMLACMMIAQMGFCSLGLLVLNENGISALLFNLFVMSISLLGAYIGINYLMNGLGSDRLENYYGVLPRAVPECLYLLTFLACFVGIPPLPGFIGRFALISAILGKEWYWLTAIAILASALLMATFGRLAFSLVGGFRSESGPALPSCWKQRVFMGVVVTPLFVLCVYADKLFQWTSESFHYLLR